MIILKVCDVINKLNTYFVSYDEYVDTVSKMLKDKNSSLYKFLIYNENMITEYYDKKYEYRFKDLIDFEAIEKQDMMEYEIRNKTYADNVLLLNPEYRRFFNFGKREKTLLKIFNTKQREQYFHNEMEFLDWIEQNEEFVLLKEWNYAWILQKMLKTYTFEYKKSKNEKLGIVISELTNNLNILNTKLHRTNTGF